MGINRHPARRRHLIQHYRYPIVFRSKRVYSQPAGPCVDVVVPSGLNQEQLRQPSAMSSSRDPTARLRAGLNPLLTASLGGYHGHHANTPLSAVSMTSHAFSSNQTPLSAIQPYNPQEWVASPALGPGSDRMQQFPPPQGHPYLEPQGKSTGVLIQRLC